MNWERSSTSMIRLVGPGGAGKSTVGLALADRLKISFVDLDEQFTSRYGDISAYLASHGYHDYARQNVQVYLDTLTSLREQAILALSSGFMTYADDAPSAYREIYDEIVTSPSAVLLLPSFDVETCVAETVRRQLRRPFARSAAREEQVIRSRFAVYCGLPMKTFETMRPVGAVVDDLVVHLYPTSPALPLSDQSVSSLVLAL